MTSVFCVLFQSHPSFANGNVSSSGPSIPRDPPGTSPILIGSPWKRSSNKWPVKVPITYPKKVEEDKWFQILWDPPETPPKRPHFVKTEVSDDVAIRELLLTYRSPHAVGLMKLPPTSCLYGI